MSRETDTSKSNPAPQPDLAERPRPQPIKTYTTDSCPKPSGVRSNPQGGNKR